MRTCAAILSGVLRDGKPKGNEMSDETLSGQSSNPGRTADGVLEAVATHIRE